MFSNNKNKPQNVGHYSIDQVKEIILTAKNLIKNGEAKKAEEMLSQLTEKNPEDKAIRIWLAKAVTAQNSISENQVSSSNLRSKL